MSSSIVTNFPLSRKHLKKFREQGAIVSNGDVSMIDMRYSPEAVATLLEIIGKLPEDQDPMVQPTFLFANTVTPAVQWNVYNVISTYEPLLAQNFAGGAIPLILPMAQAAAPPAFMWQFHHAQMAIPALIGRIGNPGPGAHTADILGLPGGSFICDLALIYGNAVFVIRIHRA
jgi:hypothetical protein